MTEYSHILEALGKQPLSPQQQVENYDAFKRLQDAGVTVPDLVKRLEALEARVGQLAESRPDMDAELFAMMAESVKDDPAVADARRRVQAEKTRAIAEMCMKDQGYKAAYDAYRAAVSSAYMAKRKD